MLSLWAGAAGAMISGLPRGWRMSLPGTADVPPGPLLRRGPRPLLLHLTLAMLRSSAPSPGCRA